MLLKVSILWVLNKLDISQVVKTEQNYAGSMLFFTDPYTDYTFWFPLYIFDNSLQYIEECADLDIFWKEEITF